MSKKFKVQNIPTLVFIDSKTCRLITTDGRNNVLDDPEGQHFPWPPRPLADILKGPLRCATGDVEADQALKGKIKGLYFSAHWVSTYTVQEIKHNHIVHHAHSHESLYIV